MASTATLCRAMRADLKLWPVRWSDPCLPKGTPTKGRRCCVSRRHARPAGAIAPYSTKSLAVRAIAPDRRICRSATPLPSMSTKMLV